MKMDVLRLLRPQQWIKNVFVYAPLFFNGNFGRADLLLQVTAVWLCFSLMSSSIYCLNDICDAETDRKHPEKKKRPVASGAVSLTVAMMVFAVLLMMSVSILLTVVSDIPTRWIMAGYIVMNILYCVKLKHYAILDVVIVSSGFVLRVVAGGVVVDIELSHWIVLVTFLLALFLSFAKRRDDILLANKGCQIRKSARNYSVEYLNNVISLISAVIIVAYIMYTVSDEVIAHFGSDYIYVTTIFVIMGLLRYLQVAMVENRTGNPTRVLYRDRFIHLCVVAWLLSFVYIIYM